jgi:hypothetical protein
MGNGGAKKKGEENWWDCGRDGGRPNVSGRSIHEVTATENVPPGPVRSRAIPVPSRAFQPTVPALNSPPPPFLVSLLQC